MKLKSLTTVKLDAIGELGIQCLILSLRTGLVRGPAVRFECWVTQPGSSALWALGCYQNSNT